MFSRKLIFEAVLGFSFGTPAFDGSICTEVSVNRFANSNGSLDIVGIFKLSCSGVNSCSAIRRALLGHTIPSRSASALVAAWPIKAVENFASLLYFYLLRCGEKSEIHSISDNMQSSGFYA